MPAVAERQPQQQQQQQQRQQRALEAGDPLDQGGIGVRCKTVNLPLWVAGRGASSSIEQQQSPFEGGDPLDQGGIGVRCKTVDLPLWVAGRGASSSIERDAGSSRDSTSSGLKRAGGGEGSSNSACNAVAPPPKSRKLAISDKDGFKQLVASVSGMATRNDTLARHAAPMHKPDSTLTKDAKHHDDAVPPVLPHSSRHEASFVDQTLERAAKRVKADATLHFPIHQVAVQHIIAASDSEDEQTDRDADSTWWNQVEACIEDDLRIDRDWWSEVEVAMKADDGFVPQSSTGEATYVGTKRESSQPCIASNAKRVKKPG